MPGSSSAPERMLREDNDDERELGDPEVGSLTIGCGGKVLMYWWPGFLRLPEGIGCEALGWFCPDLAPF